MTQADAVHAQRWLDLPERGTPASARFIVWLAARIGRAAASALLYPLALYFVVTARVARQASRDFLRRAQLRPARWWHVFRHFKSFAGTVLDRVYLLREEFKRFDVSVHGREILDRYVEQGRGCILLGSHLGSFEVLRTLGVSRKKFRLRILMDPSHNRNITGLLDALNPEIAGTVIVPDQPDTLLRVKESLEAGFLIGILGDRPTSDGKTVSCELLGGPATLPAGPVLLAAMMHCPVVLFFGLYRGGNRYEIHLENFAEEISLDRSRRQEETQHWMQRYADRLSHYARLAPYNWFNFYPFWD
jgi:predicted LPLAT superfamily acyltransferase